MNRHLEIRLGPVARLGRIARLSAALAVAGLTVSVIVPEVACAQDGEREAEKLRLIEECNKLAGRNAWAGVERCYERLELLGVDLPFEIHYLGSQSARYLGKTGEVYHRLGEARKKDPTPEVLDTLEALDRSYGRIHIIGSEKRRVPLERDVMPFAPDERKSIEWAQTVMAETGSFEGMLPGGTYKVGAQEITVEPGPDTQVVDVRKDKSGTRVGLIEWKGLVASLGYNFGLSTVPSSSDDPLDPQADTFLGNGIAASVGYEIGLNDPIGVAGGFGYTGMYGVDTWHGVNGWLAAVIRPGDLRIAVGPMYSFRSGGGTGVAAWFDKNHDRAVNPNDQLKYRAFSLAPGAHLGVSYGLIEVGGFQGVVELGGTWSTDGVRQYVDAGLRVGIVPKIDRFVQ